MKIVSSVSPEPSLKEESFLGGYDRLPTHTKIKRKIERNWERLKRTLHEDQLPVPLPNNYPIPWVNSHQFKEQEEKYVWVQTANVMKNDEKTIVCSDV